MNYDSSKHILTSFVLGAGAGGIATAARLAKKGATVTVVEKHEFVGGRCSLIHRNGYVSFPITCSDISIAQISYLIDRTEI